MKLRVRNTESKQTLRIEVPNSCSLRELKQIVAQAIGSSPSSLRLSLNRHDELHASSPEDALPSLGVIAGDLIFYSLFPASGSSTQTLASNSQSHPQSSVQGAARIEHGNPDHRQPQTLGPLPPIQEIVMEENSSVVQGSSMAQVKNLNFHAEESALVDLVSEKRRCLGEGLTAQKEEGKEISGAVSMDIDAGSVGLVGKKFSVPCFLKRVLKEVLGDEMGKDGGGHKLMLIAVHAVLVESGFVGFDSVSGMRVDRFHLPDEWPSMAFTVSLFYTLPEILGNGSHNSSLTEVVVLKFQSLGNFVNVYGALANDASGPYRVCLDKHKFLPAIASLLGANGNSAREISELWRIVKDGLAFPLLIDLCTKAGLSPPPCLMSLPSELKMKILGLLPGNDIAKLECVCKELQNLSCNDDLWKKKFMEECGSESAVQGMTPWKKRFATFWENEMAAKTVADLRWVSRRHGPFYVPRRGNPLRRGPPFFDGEHDRHFPSLSAPPPFGRRLGRFPTPCGRLLTDIIPFDRGF
ncbi:hypothetical protein FNV43_RR21604 [Rhamnella rubrinervis]|uniref:F-box domain-containing protein n=1 Tax=Rhamnella rubrinervis TaxID=2594499 RepID=A0A8K0DUJ2_9ROSA|nr:hypothetical protein FNV43_RR21604 [Rhamnella rubrinervis]